MKKKYEGHVPRLEQLRLALITQIGMIQTYLNNNPHHNTDGQEHPTTHPASPMNADNRSPSLSDTPPPPDYHQHHQQQQQSEMKSLDLNQPHQRYECLFHLSLFISAQY